jgi:single-stranded-DNA-specific exonuclease
MKSKLPLQRWQIAPAEIDKVSKLVSETGQLPLIAQVLINRGMEKPRSADVYINPESEILPPPIEEFPDLAMSVELLEDVIANGEKIGICGDYDADGMTSTALLLRTFQHLGADVEYAIPSRMKDGYGINQRIVEEFADNGVALILTVDNGISAFEPIDLARDLGLDVIVTDHHDLPAQLPPANAILNPKLLPETSPYRGLAGVGVAYILAVTLAQKLDALKGLTDRLLELFTLGTIADLAPLVGVNRRWLKRGLRKLPKSQLAGVQALMQMSGVSDEQKSLQPDDIGFRLGPRINAVGRIGDPQIVIELLTTDDPGEALERAMQCEQINQKRQQLCEQIEIEAVNLIERTPINWQEARVLLIVQPDWHHGVIGIVASRLVERYGVPTFIGTYEDEEKQHIRGSARGIKEFHVFEALDYCRDLLGKFGGHKAAGGFSLPATNLEAFGEKLSQFAHSSLQPEHLKPLIEIDAEANFNQLTPQLYQQIEALHPWGIGNPEPVFWTRNVCVLEQQNIGKGHLKLTLSQDRNTTIKAIAWRWGEYLPLPSQVDIAYKLKQNQWNGNTNIELEIVGVRLPQEVKENFIRKRSNVKKAIFDRDGRTYTCSLWESLNELRIRNERGQVLAVKRGEKIGLLGTSRESAKEIDVTQPPFYQLIKAARLALEKAD